VAEQSIFDQIQTQLEYVKSIEMAKTHLTRLLSKEQRVLQKVKQYQQILEKEYQDIVELEKLGIGHLFLKILGGYEDRLALEKEEYLQAILVHKDYIKELEAITFEKKVIQEKIDSEKEERQKLESLFTLREQEISQDNGISKKELQIVSEQVDDAISKKREIYEANIVGIKVEHLLGQMVDELAVAHEKEKWYQEGVVVNAGYAHVQNAQRILYEVNPLIFKFESELKDLYEYEDVQLTAGIENFDNVVNVYYDNLITDFMVSRRIKHSMNTIEALAARVSRTLAGLAGMERMANHDLEYLKDKRERILSQSG